MTFRMMSMIRLGLCVGLALLGGLFVSCNTEPEVEHRIDLFLQDSLSKDRGNYDSLQIDIVSTNGSVIQPLVFHGPYLAESTGGVLKGLLLGSTVPNEFDISIRAFKGDDTVLVKITVKDKVPGSVVRIDTARPNPIPPETNTVVTKVPTGLSLSDSVINLGVTSTPRQVFATLKPDSASGLILFTSTHPAIATVDGNGFVTPVAEGETRIIASVSGHAHVADALLVKVIIPPAITSVAFVSPPRILYTGAPGIKLNVSHLPADLTPVLEFKSSDDGIISVSADGTMTAKSEGSALITVSAIGASAQDTVTIRGMRDAPFIDAGQTQSVAVSQTVNIKVTVTQAFGTLNLTWDFTGDGQPEGSTTQDTATATHTYNQEGDFTATFTAKDGEGNTTTQNVRIRVGKAGPLVIITSPRNDTLVNNPAFTLRYTSDGSPKSQAFTLLEGVNVLTVRDSNATGKDSASVKVTLDTKAPVVKITSPADDAITNLSEIDVEWTVDNLARSTALKENLTGKQGLIGIVRTFTDSAGNTGRDSITITRDTVPPALPVFVGGDTTVNSKRPTWRWASSGGGNGTFAVQLGTGTAQEVTSTTFTPVVDLTDGAYTLTVRERDAAGNWSVNATKTITVKTSGPGTPTFNNALTTVSPTNNKRPTWAWVSSGVIGGGSGAFRWSVNTSTPVLDSGIATSFTPSADLSDGTYTLNLQERDALGNWSTAITRDIRILTQGALVEITAPARITYTNVKSGVVTVAWEVNDAPQTAQLTHTLTNEGAWNLIRREFRDVAGNLSFDTVSVFWDTTAPRVAITSPAAGVYVNTLTVPVTWTVDGTRQLTDTIETLAGADGTKTITRTITDRSGNTGSASVQITLDRVTPGAPTITVSPTTPARTTTASTHTWSWSGTGTAYEWRFSTTNSQTGSGTSIAGTTYSRTGALTDGTHYFQVRQVNAAGTWSSWATAPLVIDNTAPGAPTVTRNAATSNEPSWSWIANATNAGNGQFRYRWSGNASYIATGVTATNYAPTNLTDGSYNLCVSERDAVDYGTAEACQTIVVDKTLPAVIITSPSNGAYVNTNSVTVNWTVDGVAQSNTATLSVGDGPKTITRTGTDAAGNTGSASITVNLDTQAPSNPTGITTTSPTAQTSATFMWTSGGGGNGQYQVKLNNNNFSTGAIDVGGTTYPATGLTAGTHTLYVRERDAAGNWSNPASGSVFVDLTAPTITNPGNQTITSTSHSLSFTVSDGTGSGVASASCAWGANTVSATNSGSTWTCNLTGLNAKTISVTLAANDQVGRSSSATLTLTLNLPIVPITVDAKYQNYPISGSEITVPYIEGNPPGTQRTAVFTGLGAGNNARTIQGPMNAINERASVNINIVRLPNVIFVRKGASGLGNGSSWDDAFPEVNEVLSPNSPSYSSPTQAWISAGTYQPNNTYGYFMLKNNLSIYGGFSASAFAFDTTNRNPNLHVTMLQSTNSTNAVLYNYNRNNTSVNVPVVAVSGITLRFSYIGIDLNGATNASFNRIAIGNTTTAEMLFNFYNSKVRFSDSRIDSKSFSYMVGQFDQSLMVFNGTFITNNQTANGGFYAQNSTVCLDRNSDITGNASEGMYDVGIWGFEGEFQHESGANFDLGKINVLPNQVPVCPSP